MKMKSLILIFIALGCGLVATIGISQVMERNTGDGGSTVKMEQILVAKVSNFGGICSGHGRLCLMKFFWDLSRRASP